MEKNDLYLSDVQRGIMWAKYVGTKKYADCIDETVKASADYAVKKVIEYIEEHGKVEAEYTDGMHMSRSWLEIPNSRWQALKKLALDKQH